MTLSRRSLLFGLASGAAAAFAARMAKARAAQAPRFVVPGAAVAQGGTLLVGVAGPGISSAAVGFRDWEYPMLGEGGDFFAVVPAGQAIGATAQPAPGVYPIEARVEIQGVGTRYLADSVRIVATEFPVDYLTFAPSVAALLDPALTAREVATLREAYGGFTPARYWDGYFVRPSAAAVSDVYGSRRSYQGGPVTGSHSGVDFGAAAGAPVVAAAGGYVVLAQRLPVRGNAVIVDHGAGVHTGYCHLSEFWVGTGQRVRAGEPIAAVGATGLVTGAHLHWELVAGMQHVDGLRWLG
jgi:murein DD-endopeptidase MepM/ murein hydrolase activator NlpD